MKHLTAFQWGEVLSTPAYEYVLKQLSHEEIDGVISLYCTAAGDGYLDRFINDYKDEFAVTLGVFEYDTLIGFVNLSPCHFDGECISLNQIAIHPDYQGKGIGKSLLTHVENCIMSEKDTIFLSTAIPYFYQKLGYNIIPSGRKEWILMSKTLCERW